MGVTLRPLSLQSLNKLASFGTRAGLSGMGGSNTQGNSAHHGRNGLAEEPTGEDIAGEVNSGVYPGEPHRCRQCVERRPERRKVFAHHTGEGSRRCGVS